MDPYKYSWISHRDLIYCNPLSLTKMETVIGLLELAPGARVLDIGSGKAELLIRLVERYNVEAVGIDRSPHFLLEARQQVTSRIPFGKLTLKEVDATEFQINPTSLDLAICIGATEIFGGYKNTLQTLANLVQPNGQILIADLYWKREPDPDYLVAFGVSQNEYTTHAQNVAIGVAQNLVPVYATVSNDDEWDYYEWMHLRAVENYAMQHPDDPDVPALLTRIRTWRDLYLGWGRDILGFGIYLFRK